MTPLQVVPAEEEIRFTGERFVPGAGVEITYDHWTRYAFASQFVEGRRVLDVASGEGYGADFLAATAAEVVGFDISEEAIDHARRKYGQRKNLTYQRGSLLSFFADAQPASFDVVTAFEIIEHVDEDAQQAMLRGVAKVLAPGGIAVISTPDKHTYSDTKLSTNGFHVRELYRAEFQELVAAHFSHQLMYDQNTFTGSAILTKGEVESRIRQLEWTNLSELRARLRKVVEYSGQYLIAIASNSPLPRVMGQVVIDPAKKLISEEKFAMENQIRDLQTSAAHSSPPVEDGKAQWALGAVVDVLAARVAAASESQTQWHRANVENQLLRGEVEQERLRRNHIENMLAVKVALAVKNRLQRSPVLMDVARRLLTRVV